MVFPTRLGASRASPSRHTVLRLITGKRTQVRNFFAPQQNGRTKEDVLGYFSGRFEYLVLKFFFSLMKKVSVVKRFFFVCFDVTANDERHDFGCEPEDDTSEPNPQDPNEQEESSHDADSNHPF